ncbi:MAG: hypothetical protein AAF750_03325 [Planctomycetota bacterium]
MNTRSRTALPIAVISVLGASSMALVCSAGASAKVIYQTDFTTRQDDRQAFRNGDDLRFQDQWLGQDGVTVETKAPGRIVTDGTAYKRVLQGRGATGGVAGKDGSEEQGSGFTNGDVLRITIQLQYTLARDKPNQDLSLIGVRPDFVRGGFDAGPTAGFRVAFSAFGEGALKFYTNTQRLGANASDNPFALFLPAKDAGLAIGDRDLETDPLQVQYTAKFRDGAWSAKELRVTNLKTRRIVADAAEDKPQTLESTPYTGTEAFLALRLIGQPGAIASSESVRFEYIRSEVAP